MKRILINGAGGFIGGHMVKRLKDDGIDAKADVTFGLAAESLTQYAGKNGVDLIVIATHGYTGMKQLMFGSVALKVLHDAHVPVLLIRPDSI